MKEIKHTPDKYMAKKPEIMTTTGGNPVADNQNSLTAGLRMKSKFLAARS
jgi:catalase